MNNDGQGSWGFSHLSAHPITLSLGTVLLGALLLLVVLRIVFASVDVRGGVK